MGVAITSSFHWVRVFPFLPSDSEFSFKRVSISEHWPILGSLQITRPSPTEPPSLISLEGRRKVGGFGQRLGVINTSSISSAVLRCGVLLIWANIQSERLHFSFFLPPCIAPYRCPFTSSSVRSVLGEQLPVEKRLQEILLGVLLPYSPSMKTHINVWPRIWKPLNSSNLF